MSAPTSLRRRLSCHLVRHASRVLPQTRSEWAQAMQHEVGNIESDGAALRWAIGCVLAGYAERIKAIDILHVRLIRWGLALPIAFAGLQSFFDACLPLAYRLKELGIAGWLGLFTEGDDYRRYVALFDELPNWSFGLSMSAGTLYVIAAWQLLRKSRSTAYAFAAALLLNYIDWLVMRSSPAFNQVFSPHHVRSDYIFFSALAILGASLWTMARPTVPPAAGTG